MIRELTMPDGPTEIRKEKEGTWHPKVVYWAYYQGTAIGKYKTKREAKNALEAHIQAELEYWRSLGEEFK